MNKKTFLLLALAVPLLAMGAGCAKSDTSKQGTAVAPVVVVPNSVSTSPTPDDDTVITNLKNAISKSKQTDQVFMDPRIDRLNEMKIYYVTNASVATPVGMPNNDGSGIYVYDITKDKAYQKDGTIDINEGSSELFYQMIPRDRMLRGVGFIENKFVFVEQDIDNSPGMCGSPWLYPDLHYIVVNYNDPNVTKATKKPFTISEDSKKSEQKKVDACQKTFAEPK